MPMAYYAAARTRTSTSITEDWPPFDSGLTGAADGGRRVRAAASGQRRRAGCRGSAREPALARRSSSSMIAVSAIATPVRCSSRAAKSAAIAATAAAYAVAVAGRERAQRRRGALERAAARVHDLGERRDRVVVAGDQRGDREHVGGDGRAGGVGVVLRASRAPRRRPAAASPPSTAAFSSPTRRP